MFLSDELISKKNFSVDNIISKCILGDVVSDEEEVILLSYVICWAMDSYSSLFHCDAYVDSLSNRCDYFQFLIGHFLENYGFKVFPKETHRVIHPCSLGHSFLIVKGCSRSYIVDPSFRQFCICDNCDINNIVVSDNKVILNVHPGYFVFNSSSGALIGNKLLRDGFVVLDEESASVYCNSFYNSRQGVILKNGSLPCVSIPGRFFLDILNRESFDYSLSSERFNSLYGGGFVK